jgi:hypothetical protein
MRNPLAARAMFETCYVCRGTGSLGTMQPCQSCHGTGRTCIRCPSCWTWRSSREFLSKKGGLVARCHHCRTSWQRKSSAPELRRDGPLRVAFVTVSGNRKTGPIPVAMTSASTCPDSCPLRWNGCYAEQHLTAIHWRRLSSGKGLTWDEFIAAVRKLPEGQLWRYGEAGDLPGLGGDYIDCAKLSQLVDANRGKRGFTYTHYPFGLPRNRHAIESAVANGFTINMSANSLEHADRLARTSYMPVTTIVPHNARGPLRTPAGHTVVLCPAIDHEHVTCATCRLCANARRKCIVGFRAHGDKRKQLTQNMQQLSLRIQ